MEIDSQFHIVNSQNMTSKLLLHDVEGFENCVWRGLLDCGIDLAEAAEISASGEDAAGENSFASENAFADVRSFSLGAAVSGGADSVAMLVALAVLCKKNNVPLSVVTVNHNIRSEEESSGDAFFVRDLCEKLSDKNFLINCTIKEIPCGAVEKVADERGGGREDAARFLRYRHFEEFARESGADFICLAHTRDDNLETILMRFLQGNSVSGGIKRVRGIFVRPLLDVSRVDIENYLRGKNISWRTDSTNSDTNFLRNRIRHQLVPHLDEINPNWRRSVLNGAERASDAEEVIAGAARGIKYRYEDDCVFFERESFAGAFRAARVYAVYDAINALGVEKRVPYSFVAQVADLVDDEPHTSRAAGTGERTDASRRAAVCRNITASGKAGTSRVISAAGIEAGISESQVFVKKLKKQATDFGFYAIICKEGKYILPFGIVRISAENINDGKCVLAYFPEKKIGMEKCVVENLTFPFCIRNKMAGDEVACADGSMRSVSDIFAAWKIPSNMRDLIPLVQNLCNGEIVALLGSVYGFYDWIVK